MLAMHISSTVVVGSTQITTVRCVSCGSEESITHTPEAFSKWVDGETAQQAFPEFSAAQRELLISGICEECFPSKKKASGVTTTVEDLQDMFGLEWGDYVEYLKDE